MSPPDVQRLDQVFAVLSPELGVDTIAVTPTLYERLDADYGGFRGHTLVAIHEFSRPWGTWEMHPAGDEIVVLLSGQVRFRVRDEAGERSVELSQAGEFLVVPKGRWHTAETAVTTRLLFVTPGEGTAHESDA
ncbi:MAG: cupin domain-containing protein [Gammaproteobacteria bacterium]